MSCVRSAATFRLLDAYTGWDEKRVEQIAGLDDPAGLYLDFPSQPGIPAQELARFIPPRRLARGCEPCVWYLLTPPPLASRLLRLGPCTHGFQPLLEGKCGEFPPGAGVAVAAGGPYVAVAAESTVWVFTHPHWEAVAEIHLRGVRALAFTPWLELLVACEYSDRTLLSLFSPTGEPLGILAETPTGVDRMAMGRDCRLWVVTEKEGVLSLWTMPPHGTEVVPATLADLEHGLPKTDLAAVGTRGFCLHLDTGTGSTVTCCYSWYGRCTEEGELGVPPPVARFRQGQLLTLPIDSGVPHCRWHRVRVDADVPAGCAVEVAVSTSEDEAPVAQATNSPDPGWTTFAAGVPHPEDWQTDAGTLTDYLVRQPVGRHLFVRIRLTGDGAATPRVRRIRLDFERGTSLESLPAVYRDNPDAEDFTERFLSIFDAQLEEMDDAITAAPAILRTGNVPDELLPWLATFLDAGFDLDWPPEQRRRILAALPSLYRRRGTVPGLTEILTLVFGSEPVITEYGLERAWGALGKTVVIRQTRLFGRGRARFRLGESALCRAPLNNYGDARQDPFSIQAYQFGVTMPPAGEYGRIRPDKLAQLVEAQKPAHTVATVVRVGGDGFFVGRDVRLGADTLLAPLPPSVLGKNGSARLRRRTILYSRIPRPGLRLRAGEGTVLDGRMVLN